MGVKCGFPKPLYNQHLRPSLPLPAPLRFASTQSFSMDFFRPLSDTQMRKIDVPLLVEDRAVEPGPPNEILPLGMQDNAAAI
jgi:hypothetical protein